MQRPAVDPIAKGVPHGATIRSVAITDQGDAALSTDELGAMRLWPTLDGTRPAVAVDTPSHPEQIALLHDGRDLVAIVLDTAGGVTLTRLGLDGTVYGHAQLEGPATYEEVAAVGRQVIARTNDSAIELYDADGTFRGRVVAAPGERISDIATRHGRAAAIVATEQGSFMRWVSVGPHVAWGTTLALPFAPREGLFAIAPRKDRIAFVDVANTGLHVLDVDVVPTPAIGPRITVNESTVAVGFIDDNTAVAMGSPTLWWTPKAPSNDPWAVPDSPPPPQPSFGGGDAGDGRIVQPTNIALALSDTAGTHYLGWKDTVVSALPPSFDQIVLASSGYQFNWLDENLQSLHTYNVLADRGPNDPWMSGTVIGPHHLLRVHQELDDSSTWILELVDTASAAKPISIGRFPRYDRHDYDNGMLAVIAGGNLRRFQVDLERDRITELAPQVSFGQTVTPSWVKLFDPAKANGVVALVLMWEDPNSSHQTLFRYHLVNGTIEKTKVGPFDGLPLRVEEDGRFYTFDSGPTPAIVQWRAGREELRVPVPVDTIPMAVSRGGDRFAVHKDNDVVMLDASGRELWRQTIWGASSFGFIASGKRLGVLAPGGVVALETDTGKQVARECGWSFGLHDKPLEAGGIGMAPVCEDPIVQ